MADFLKCILNIPDEEFEDLEFLDTHIRKGSALDGEYILDIKVKTKSYVIDVEMQVKRSLPLWNKELLCISPIWLKTKVVKTLSIRILKRV